MVFKITEEEITIVRKVIKHIVERARDSEEVEITIYPREVAEAIGENYYRVRSFLKSFAKNRTGSITRIEELNLVSISFMDDFRTELSFLERIRSKRKRVLER